MLSNRTSERHKLPPLKLASGHCRLTSPSTGSVESRWSTAHKRILHFYRTAVPCREKWQLTVMSV